MLPLASLPTIPQTLCPEQHSVLQKHIRALSRAHGLLVSDRLGKTVPKAKTPAQHARLCKLGQGLETVGTRLEACVFLLWVVEQTTQFYPTGYHK